jgi:hypothetical protein
MKTRIFIDAGILALCLGLSGSAAARKKHSSPTRSIPGGASQKWACQQLAENACDVAKRCDPDKSLRRCKKLRERCASMKDRPSHTATEDDVTVCAQAVADLGCKQVSFDNSAGVRFDLKKLETCSSVAKDDPLPPAKADSAGDDEPAPPATAPKADDPDVNDQP